MEIHPDIHLTHALCVTCVTQCYKVSLLCFPGDGFSRSARSSSLHRHWGLTSHGLHCHRHRWCYLHRQRCLGCELMRHRPPFSQLDNLSSLATRGFRFGSSKRITEFHQGKKSHKGGGGFLNLKLNIKVTQSPSANRWSLAIVVSFKSCVNLLKLPKYFF